MPFIELPVPLEIPSVLGHLSLPSCDCPASGCRGFSRSGRQCAGIVLDWHGHLGHGSNWGLASGGPYNTAAWTKYSDANFEGVAGTVTVSGTQDFDGLVFTTTGYTLTGGTIQIGNPGSPYFYVATGDTATINSAL